jgi:hypothetical protein
MRSVGRIAAAIVAAAAFCIAASHALAEDDESDGDETALSSVSEPDEDDEDDEGSPWSVLGGSNEANQPLLSYNDYPELTRLLLFSGTDLWRNGGYAHGGMLWSPHGFRDDGPVVKLIFGGGVYQYRSGALGNIDVIGRQFSGSLLPGWRFRRDSFTVSVYAGYDFQNHRLFPDDPSASRRGGYNGVRAALELWYQPNADTMFAADASISSAGRSYSVRTAPGWRVAHWFYLGPEFQAFAAGDNYRQYRAGAHVTGLRIGEIEWNAGIGWAFDSDDRNGPYGKLGIVTRH